MLGKPVTSFSGTASEKVIYERAVRLWKQAAIVVKAERFIRPTLGASVYRKHRWGA